MGKLVLFATLLLGSCLADTLTLRSGQVINGTFLGGTARQVRMEVGDRIQTFDLTEVSTIHFGAAAPSARSGGFDSGRPTLRRAEPRDRDEDEPRPTLRRANPEDRGESPILRPDPQPLASTQPAPLNVELPTGTPITVRMIDAVDSERNRVGQTFRANLDEAIMIDGRNVIERGADVIIKLVDSKDSGTFTGNSQLTLNLVSVSVNGHPVEMNTKTVSQTSAGRGASTAKRAAGVGAVGAVIGAIAGGGKGAAIGAGAGAAVGAGSEVITGGPKVRIPSETRLTFSLESSVKL